MTVEEVVVAGAIPGVLLFLLSTRVLQRNQKETKKAKEKKDGFENQAIESNSLSYWIDSICSNLLNRYLHGENGSIDNDFYTQCSATTDSSEHTKHVTAAEERLHEMQRIFGHQREEFCARSISRVNSSR